MYPEGPRIEKIQSREAILKKSSFQYGMKFSIGNGFFIPGPSLAAEKQGPGLKFSIENESFNPRMEISSENENFVRGGMVFSCVRARNDFFRSPGPLGMTARMPVRQRRETLRCHSNVNVGLPWPCYRGHLGPSGRKLQIEFEIQFPGPLGPGAPNVRAHTKGVMQPHAS